MGVSFYTEFSLVMTVRTSQTFLSHIEMIIWCYFIDVINYIVRFHQGEPISHSSHS